MRLILFCCLLLIAGCASVPFDYPREPSTALPPGNESSLDQAAREWAAENGDTSGFIGISEGVDALGARLRMIESAERSIDAQYFIIKRDRAGALFVGKMLLAADRGVKVRLLVDDIFSPGVDHPFALIDSHPNVEVRLFNPLSRNSFKYWSYLVDFSRANRRMHNKSFTVDNAFSIVGGRNIGEEYFELNQDVKFDDYELLAVGPVVDEISQGFDAYWNSDLAVPIAAFEIETDPAELDEWRDYIDRHVKGAENDIYSTAVNSTLLQEIREGHRRPVPAEAVLITDTPEKLQGAIGDEELATLAVEMRRRFLAAQSEILLITPYFIPQEGGVKLIEQLINNGLRVVIVTNSLASTNHVPVHSGYARYRKRLLEAGVEFYEIRAINSEGDNDWGNQPEFVTLHSKATVIDRNTIFVGSLNFDPRSIRINTEMGLFIESDVAGAGFSAAIYEDLPRAAYRVELDERGQLRWVYEHGGQLEVTQKEPLASWWRRTQAKLYRLLPIENQL